MNPSQYRKALVAAGGSALTALVAGFGAALSDGNLTAPECLVALGAACAAAAAVGRTTFNVENADS